MDTQYDGLNREGTFGAVVDERDGGTGQGNGINVIPIK